MDGRVLADNLHRKGLDEQWLQTQLQAQGFQSAKEVFLGLCDQNNQLSLYRPDGAADSRRSRNPVPARAAGAAGRICTALSGAQGN